MDHYSRIAVILGLFFAIAFAERKINLEDIEHDNLRAESKSGTEGINAEETSYGVTAKPETTKLKYQHESQDFRNDEGNSDYEASRQLPDNYNARPEDYQQDVKYLSNNVDYQQTPETPQRQLYYQPEVSVGNQYQSVQQRAASEKFAKNSNGETLYVNIPMAQLLSYYPHIALQQSTISNGQVQPLLHRYTSQSDRQIAIPIYMPPLSRDPIYSNSKITYQIQPQYASQQSPRYPLVTEAILPTRSPSKLIYTQGLIRQQQPQAQTHYLQEIVYNQQPDALTYVPAISSSHDANLYERPLSARPESDSLSQNYASQSRQQQSYAPYDRQSVMRYAISGENYAPQLSNHIYQQQNPENVQQDYENIPDAPESELDLPRLPAQNFKLPDTTRLSQIPRENEAPHYTHNHLVHSSEPRSLLDSYIPSTLIAAHNSERYRERPIKLESGFLPSKINYVKSYEKRKIE